MVPDGYVRMGDPWMTNGEQQMRHANSGLGYVRSDVCGVTIVCILGILSESSRTQMFVGDVGVLGRKEM